MSIGCSVAPTSVCDECCTCAANPAEKGGIQTDILPVMSRLVGDFSGITDQNVLLFWSPENWISVSATKMLSSSISAKACTHTVLRFIFIIFIIIIFFDVNLLIYIFFETSKHLIFAGKKRDE